MTFRFSTKGTGFEYRSNQAIRLFLPGIEDPWGPVRTFSLSSSPTERDEVAVTVKITDTPYKHALRSLKPGAPAEIVGPLGDLFYNPRRNSVFIAGGIGISPFRGMMRYATDTGADTRIITLYSARTPEEFAFRDELESMARANPRLETRYTVTRPNESRKTWSGRTGRIDEAWVREAVQELDRPKVYVVGLPEMAQEILGVLKGGLGFAEDDLEYEYFMGY